MKSYRRLTWLLALLVGLLLLGGVQARFAGETFPLFSWSLFSVVPQADSIEEAVLILEVDDRQFEPPLDFMEAPEVVPENGGITGYYLIRAMAREHLADSAGAEQRTYRDLFEKEYLNFFRRRISYTLVRRSYDPVERWKTGRYEVTGTIFRRTLTR